MKEEKTKKEILDQIYLSAKDLMILIPHLKEYKARGYINEARETMKKENIRLPNTKTKLAKTSVVKKMFNF